MIIPCRDKTYDKEAFSVVIFILSPTVEQSNQASPRQFQRCYFLVQAYFHLYCGFINDFTVENSGFTCNFLKKKHYFYLQTLLSIWRGLINGFTI